MSSELAELFVGAQTEVRLLRSRIMAEAPLNVAFNQELTKLEGLMERCWDENLKLVTSQTPRRPAPAETVNTIRQALAWVRAQVQKLIGFLDDRKKSIQLPRIIPTLQSLAAAASSPTLSPTPSTASSTCSSVSTQYSAVQYYQHSIGTSSPGSGLLVNSPTPSSSLNFNGSIFGHDSPVPSIYWSTTPPPRPPTPARDRTPLTSTDSGYLGSTSSSVSSFNPPNCSTSKYQPLPLKKTRRC